jgi:hypothetical protein
LRFVHFGEGDYSHTEDVIRGLLGVPATAPRARQGGSEPNLALVMTPETYLGAAQGEQAFSSPEPLATGEHVFTAPSPLPTDRTALVGRWLVDAEYVESTAASDGLLLSYRGREVNLVMAPAQPGARVDVNLEIDGRPIDAAARGPDVVVGGGGTLVHVDASDLYHLVLSPGLEHHVLRIKPLGPGLRLYAFTFGA